MTTANTSPAPAPRHGLPPLIFAMPVWPVRSSLRIRQEIEAMQFGYALGGEYRQRRTLR